MNLQLFAAGAMLVGLVVYALTGGADFGGGILELFARGPRKADQQRAIEGALAPVWEANHVWLIFVVVVLFTAFPPAFARMGIDLHIPLTVMLIGIVFRGSAFVFRHYGAPHTRGVWGQVFAWSSVLASLFLGIVLGALTAGTWLAVFPVAVGIMTLVGFAFLAATYLCLEPIDDLLREDFRHRALIAGPAFAVAAAACAALAPGDAHAFAADLFGSWPMRFLLASGIVAFAIALRALHRRHFRMARVFAAATVALVITGWAVAHYPMLVAPDITVANAAAPRVTLAALVPVLLVGSVILLPSLWWLMRVFKTARSAEHSETR